LCILRNENDPTTKLLNKLKVDYDNVKEEFKSMITSEDDYLDTPKSESFLTMTSMKKRMTAKQNLLSGIV
jgi:ATP-dependent Clp protease ATP-binding subunit ClpC